MNELQDRLTLVIMNILRAQVELPPLAEYSENAICAVPSKEIAGLAIDTVCEALLSDGVVENAKTSLLDTRWGHDHILNGDGFQVMVNCYLSRLSDFEEHENYQITDAYKVFLNDVLEKTIHAVLIAADTKLKG